MENWEAHDQMFRSVVTFSFGPFWLPPLKNAVGKPQSNPTPPKISGTVGGPQGIQNKSCHNL